MVSSVAIAALAFLALVGFMLVTRNNRVNQLIISPAASRRTRAVVLMLAITTGLLGSLPFALAGATHSVASFLLREVTYASLTTLGVLGFNKMMVHIATGQTDSDGYEPVGTAMSGHRCLFRINPASGLPMKGALDVAGNVYGESSYSTMPRALLRCHEPR